MFIRTDTGLINLDHVAKITCTVDHDARPRYTPREPVRITFADGSEQLEYGELVQLFDALATGTALVDWRRPTT